MFDVAVIGAGVVGGMIVRELSRYHLDVCLVEAKDDVACGASRANSAIVHAGFDAAEGSLKARFNVRGSQMMEDVARDLGVKYRRNGSLVIGFSKEDRRSLEALLERGRRNGVEGLALLTGDEAREKEPALSPAVTAALWAPTGAIVCPYELAVAAAGNAMDNGVKLFCETPVTRIEETADGYLLNGTLAARYIVNAAGLYADEVARLIGDNSFAVHPRRGEYLLMDKAAGTLVSSTIFRVPSAMGKGILVTPTVDGNMLAGPTSVDMSDKTDTATTAEGLAQVTAQALDSVPDLPVRQVITSFCGLRAAGDTGDFIIRPSALSPRFIHVAGIESPGLSSAPAIAEYVAELLSAAGLALRPKAQWDGRRAPTHAFREGSIEEKNAVIAKDARYGRIVCRCEGVTEGEIVAAIRQNPPATSVDAVKRRTRGGMGRCQGGFCMPLVCEILARELGIPLEEVTKRGSGSRINVGRTKEEQA